MLKVKKIIEKYFYQIICIILLLRISYVFFFKNRSGDYGFYERIAKGIINGCGYAIQNPDGSCIPVVGHYMPGFHYFMSVFYLFGSDAKLFLVFISILHFFAALFLFRVINHYMKDSYFAKKVFIVITLSPLTLGFNRILLMEPLLTSLSIVFLAFIIKIYFEGFKVFNYLILLFFFILAIYIKPTAILFMIPFLILGLHKLGFKKLINKLVISLTIIVISISPWGMRNLSQGANAPFTSFLESSFFPKHSDGYLNWLSTWIITEHEQSNNAFIVWRPPFNMNLEKNDFNPFISDKELNQIRMKFNEPVVFTEEDNIYFNDLAAKRRKKLGILGNTLLHSSKILSLIFNPLNSWGWPIEVSNRQDIKSNSIKFENLIELDLLKNLSLKFILFIYRVLLFIPFFKITINSLKVNYYNELDNIIIRSSFLILLGILYLISIHYPSLEHRFLSISIPWIETSFLISLNSNKEEKVNSFEKNL